MYVCMYVWLCWVFVSVRGVSLVVARGGHSSSRCKGLSLSRPLAAEHRLQMRRLSNRGPRAEPLRGRRDPPRPGPEPASPALAGRIPTTAPPGKPAVTFFKAKIPSFFFFNAEYQVKCGYLFLIIVTINSFIFKLLLFTSPSCCEGKVYLNKAKERKDILKYFKIHFGFSVSDSINLFKFRQILFIF